MCEDSFCYMTLQNVLYIASETILFTDVSYTLWFLNYEMHYTVINEEKSVIKYSTG